jgi:hypothetical protein
MQDIRIPEYQRAGHQSIRKPGREVVLLPDTLVFWYPACWYSGFLMSSLFAALLDSPCSLEA